MFVTFKNWLLENKKEEPHYGCIMLNTHIKNWNKICKLIVDEKDLYDNEDKKYGYENQPHITVLYGLHDDEIDKTKLFKEMEKLKSVTSTITKINIFENEEYDVVKFEVPLTKQLENYNKIFIENFENTNTYKGTYKPHVTIGYVKKGMGEKYKQKLIDPIEIIFDEGVYSDYNRKKKYFKLK